MQLYETNDSIIHVQWKIQADYVEMAWGSIEFLWTYAVCSKTLKLALFVTIKNTILFQSYAYVPDTFKPIRTMLQIILSCFSP